MEAPEECQNCPKGYYTDQRAATVCNSCSSGSFQDRPGSSSCIACAAGSYAEDPASFECASCPVNSDNAIHALLVSKNQTEEFKLTKVDQPGWQFTTFLFPETNDILIQQEVAVKFDKANDCVCKENYHPRKDNEHYYHSECKIPGVKCCKCPGTSFSCASRSRGEMTVASVQRGPDAAMNSKAVLTSA